MRNHNGSEIADEKKPKSPYQELFEKIAEGSALGSAGITVLTPFMYWTSRVADKQKFEWRLSMKSAPTLISSVAPVTAVAYAINQLATEFFPFDNANQKIAASVFAGSIAGIVNTPFEVIAQDKQLRSQGSGIIDTAKQIVKANGSLALMRGTAMVMTRESSWAATYMSLTPTLSLFIQLSGHNKSLSDVIAAIIVGGAFGVASTPLHMLRYEKQKGLMALKPNESYWSIALRNGIKGLFAPVLPRTVTTIAAAAIFTKGNEWVKEYSPFSAKH